MCESKILAYSPPTFEGTRPNLSNYKKEDQLKQKVQFQSKFRFLIFAMIFLIYEVTGFICYRQVYQLSSMVFNIALSDCQSNR